MSIPSIGKARYAITFIDDKTRMTFVYFMRNKDKTFTKFREFWSIAENQTGEQIKILRSDNGGEYISNNFLKYLKAHGIIHQNKMALLNKQIVQ